MKVKMVILLRKDLNMPKGKCVAQGGHGILNCYRKILKLSEESILFNEVLNCWELNDEEKKIGLKVQNEEELLSIYNKSLEYNDLGVINYLIIDNGLTMFNNVKTVTGLALLGPSDMIDNLTGHLPLL